MKRMLTGLAALLLAASPMACLATDPPDVQVGVALRDGDRPALEISLTNPGADTLDLWSAMLPWSNHYAMDLDAVTSDLKKRLERSRPIDDPGANEARVPPHETLTGRVDLLRQFKGLQDIRKTNEVIVSWSYSVYLSGGERTRRYHGIVRLPKRP